MSNYKVDREKWAKMSIFEQMGNIYSEVGRSFKARQKADTQQTNEAIARAIDLFDATCEGLIERKSPRVREVLRARDQYLAVLFGDNAQDQPAIEKYFMQYAFAARLSR